MSILIDIATGDPRDAAKQYQTAGYMLAFLAGKGDHVSFDPAGHIYRLIETGEILPSVTAILKDTGVSKDFDDLASMGSQKKHDIELKREIGTALHADTHAFDDNDIVLERVDPLVRPYLDAWITFRYNYPQLKPAVRERLVYHPGYRFAGTLDGIFLLGYERDIEITERWSVQLTPDRKIPYRVTPYLDHYGDMEAFKSFATTWHHQIVRRAA